ncbi:MauE/DoxX family redox-associated membrane protein [Jiulongibacter sediminis]|uniref:Methylamine utilisation protein MauE domain-containing protein n=1 Tax=Jiulongibacter sediminis TaxID=1605367 RepID=A0A0P7C3H6_9BACT|nr:MauE/DoxX family redox-associated membrane protein [Jiulongibacter sediminis]KPM47687.1 hypothetical protein AFM12_14565 [Jiulongibacter sediminis]TBX23481.1 hypothetical protein TK44_14575 [Jiulongibacter sediminis]
MTFTKQDKIEIFENAISWVVVLAMFLYGGAKGMQFDGAAQIDKTVSEMTGMQLMWAFYGYSKPFAITIGVFEVLGGLLILIKRTRLIGCLVTSTILVNVILWLNRDKLMTGVKALLKTEKIEETRKVLFLKLSIAFALFVLFRILEYFLTVRG